MANLFYKYVVKSNLFIAVCACCFYMTGLFLIDNTAEWPPFDLLAVIFLSTFLIYTVSQKPFSFSEFSVKIWVKRRWALIIAGLLIVYFSLHLSPGELSVFLVLGLVSFLYNSLPFKNTIMIPLRGVPLLKVFLIAFVWTGVGMILPALHTGFTISIPLILLAISQFFFILAITLPFDIRDFYKDFRNNLTTVPSAIGIKNTKLLAYFFLVLHAFGILFYHLPLAVFYLPFLIIVFLFIKNSNASRPNYHYVFLIDGLIILQFVVIDLFFNRF